MQAWATIHFLPQLDRSQTISCTELFANYHGETISNTEYLKIISKNIWTFNPCCFRVQWCIDIWQTVSSCSQVIDKVGGQCSNTIRMYGKSKMIMFWCIYAYICHLDCNPSFRSLFVAGSVFIGSARNIYQGNFGYIDSIFVSYGWARYLLLLIVSC